MAEHQKGELSVARRVSSRDRVAGGMPRPAGPGRAWLLRIAPLMLAVPLVWGLLAGDVGDVVALAVGLALIYLGTFLVESGLAKEADYHARDLVKAPRPPRKLLGAIVVALGVFVCSLGASGAGVPLSLLLGALAGVGCLMTYGTDPTKNKGLAPELARKAGRQHRAGDRGDRPRPRASCARSSGSRAGSITVN